MAAGVDHGARPIVARCGRHVLHIARGGPVGGNVARHDWMPPEDAVLALQCVQQAAGVAILRRPAAPVERHALHAAAVEGRHQDGEHAGKAGARGQQHQMVDAVGAADW
ncbi:hypothetical protein G6F66_015283 [Rhizopus arrhizus]|nr:hypothetical protein G6F66_015283 [Rhizopus arrhizus]